MTARRAWLASSVTGLAALLLPLKAAASGTAIAFFGGEHGTVNATNPTALYYNPGALGFSEGVQLFADGQIALRSLRWTHTQSQGDSPEPEGFAGSNYGQAQALNLFGGPMLGATLRLGSFALGAAAYAPFGGEVSFDRDESFTDTMYPGAADGVARWHAISASSRSIYTTLGAAYRWGPVSFGLTGNLIFTTLSLKRAQTLNGTNDLTREGRSSLDVSGVHGSVGAGLMVEAVEDRLWLGLSYQAQPGFGVMQLDGTIQITQNTQASAEETLVQDVSLYQVLPDIWRLGARMRPSANLELRVAADWTRWSAQRTQCIALRDVPCQVTASGAAAPDSGTVQNLRRYWKDSFGARAGVSYWTAPTLELFAGLGFETAATPDSTLDPVLPDANRMALAGGARMEVVESWFVAASYTHLQFFDRDNTGKSALADPETSLVSRRADGGGRYTQWVGLLNVNVLKAF